MLGLLSSFEFNLIEGVFWLVCGVMVFCYRWWLPLEYNRWGLFSAGNIFLFGLSDFVQALYGGFLLPGMEWLLVWKILHVIGLVLSVVWYLKLRIAK